MTEQTWVDKLPTKIQRHVIFTGTGLMLDALGAGGIGTLISTSLSTFDQFYLDKLLKEWKPNQFIDGPLKKFIQQKGN